MDLVYVVRPGEHNEELRYSLRSLVNLPHERVVIVGDKPPWVRGVEVIAGNRRGSKLANEADDLWLACERWDSFVVMNDDFYVVEPVTAVVPRHGGPLSAWGRRGPFAERVRAACAIAARLGHVDPLVWSRHTPLPVEAERLASALRHLEREPWERGPLPEWKTLYGNLAALAGEEGPDAKVVRAGNPVPPGPYWSSSPASFPVLVAELARRFPTPSPYEAAG